MKKQFGKKMKRKENFSQFTLKLKILRKNLI